MGIGGAVIAVASGFQLARRYFEEPEYEVVREDGDFEVRRYGPRVIAETFVSVEDRRAATSVGFSRLAEYIFGGNEKIAMTTPVEATPGDEDGERIAMTTPVEAEPSEAGWRVVFTMPSERHLADLPRPRDPRVILRETPGRTVATMRFSGFMNDRLRRENERALRERLAAEGLRPTSPVTVAIYDPPSVVLPFFRRNEVMVEVEAL